MRDEELAALEHAAIGQVSKKKCKGDERSEAPRSVIAAGGEGLSIVRILEEGPGGTRRRGLPFSDC